jgi:hypothetical protein
MSAALTALTVAAKVTAGAAGAGGTAVVEVVRGVVVVDMVTVGVLVEVDVDKAAGAAGAAGTVEFAADEESDDVGELRAVEPVPPHALSVSRGSATEIAFRSQ